MTVETETSEPGRGNTESPVDDPADADDGNGIVEGPRDRVEAVVKLAKSPSMCLFRNHLICLSSFN